MKIHVLSFEFQTVADGRVSTRRAFSLVEVLLAIFILGIGLIMVASVFPVGANWTRQAAEASVGQNVGEIALSVIQRHYGVNGDLHFFFAPDFLNAGNQNSILKRNLATPFAITPFTLQPLPGFVPISAPINTPGIPVYERAYQFGSANPFPASNIQACTYFWTALARLSPVHRNPQGSPGDATNGILPSSSYSYDVYILVFRKGSSQNTFSTNVPSGYFDLVGLRDFDDSGTINGAEALIPSVGYAPYSFGSHDPARSPSVYNAVPAMGSYGIGAYSGTVFHQVLDSSANLGVAGPGGATPRPLIIRLPAIEPIIYCPAADGADNSASPLIYIYQTTLTF